MNKKYCAPDFTAEKFAGTDVFTDSGNIEYGEQIDNSVFWN